MAKQGSHPGQQAALSWLETSENKRKCDVSSRTINIKVRRVVFLERLD